ncbi:piezo-type mechanosensitive ion channel component 2-like [Amphiura filiformis]|uniref:piezo-type mechanosensitive ion channel component 2-like n=1 Tax=Amphiura filiformis TaxID=82378 RepID=UPI003B20E63E
MIIDRGIYLRKSLKAKFIFLILMVILVHAWMFFLLPKINNRKFVDNTPAQLWYFFKCIYFGLSAFQVRSGYPTRILGNCICKSYSIVNLGMFYVWKLCPFVLELRILMDWIWTKTTLTLAHWVVVEDIFNAAYIIKCWRDFENEYPHLRGQEKEKIVKYLQGGGMLLGIIFIIWFPLILISLSNTATIKNPPSEAHFTLQLGRYEPLFVMRTQEEDLEPISDADWHKLNMKFEEDLEARTFISSFRREDVVVITIPGNSSSTWDISPPTKASLYNDLISPTNKVVLKAKYSFGRDLDDESVAASEVGNEHYVQLDPEDPADRYNRETIAKQIGNEHYVQLDPEDPADRYNRETIAKQIDNSYLGTVDLLNVFPPYILVPAIGVAEPVKSLLPRNNYGSYSNITLGLERAGDTEWWSMSEIQYHGDPLQENLQPFLTIYTFNERVDSKLFAPFSSYGIIGLYISFVLVVGRLVRLIFSGTSETVMFTEFPNVDYILKLCQDLYTVREGGEMELEEDLTAKLLFLYRSPETLIQFTKYKKRLKNE